MGPGAVSPPCPSAVASTPHLRRHQLARKDVRKALLKHALDVVRSGYPFPAPLWVILRVTVGCTPVQLGAVGWCSTHHGQSVGTTLQFLEWRLHCTAGRAFFMMITAPRSPPGLGAPMMVHFGFTFQAWRDRLQSPCEGGRNSSVI